MARDACHLPQNNLKANIYLQESSRTNYGCK